jgi:TPR repeat protein
MGIGVAEDPAVAALWYRKAADRGSSDATYNLGSMGSMHEAGRGVPRDLGKARELYQRAARMGNADAQRQLARMGGH